MANSVLANRVRVTTTTTGTGTVTLGSAYSNAYTTFAEAGITNGQLVRYELEEGADFEIGQGTYTSSGTTLSRDTVNISKIGGTAGTSKMNLAGAATVRIVFANEDRTSVATGFGLTGGTFAGSGTVSVSTSAPASGFDPAINLGLAASVGSNALTIAVKGADGNDASATNPVVIPFRSATAATGTPVWRSLTAAQSLVISSGSTLGATSATAFRIWIVEFDDGGTLRIGAINCRSSTNIYPLRDDLIASSTAEGGAGGADSAQVIYTGSAVTSKAYRVIGYAEWSSGLTTAGTWDAGPTKLQLFGPGQALPGETVSENFTVTGALATTTAVIPNDNTIPQSGEGAEFMTLEHVRQGAANVLEIEHRGTYCPSSQLHLTANLFQDSGADALACGPGTGGADFNQTLVVRHRVLAAATGSTIFKIRGGPLAAGTARFNAIGSAAAFGGTINSYLSVKEIMG